MFVAPRQVVQDFLHQPEGESERERERERESE